MASTREIAQQAGVSIGTVSRVLNNKPGVGKETRERVLAAAQELSYRPSRSLPLAYSTISHLGLLSRPLRQDLMANPFYADVFHGVEQLCRELHVNLSLSVLDAANGQLRSLPALIKDERIGGLILVGVLAQRVVEQLAAAAPLPIVLVDNYFPACRWDAVVIDNANGMAAATEHLIAAGHRHIVLASGPDHPSIVERRAGYEETMLRHGLSPIIVTTPDLDPEDGEVVATEIVARWPQATAVVCSNDTQALGVMRKLAEMGYRVPEEMSLAGFDDITLIQVTSPTVTTVRVDRHALGRIAVELLLGRINSPGRPPVRCVLSVSLVERASVSRPRPEGILLQKAAAVQTR